MSEYPSASSGDGGGTLTFNSLVLNLSIKPLTQPFGSSQLGAFSVLVFLSACTLLPLPSQSIVR